MVSVELASDQVMIWELCREKICETAWVMASLVTGVMIEMNLMMKEWVKELRWVLTFSRLRQQVKLGCTDQD